MEIWKPIVNYEGYYEISDQGRVRSLGPKGIIRVLNQDPKGYYQVNLSKHNIQRNIQVHAEMIKAFFGVMDTNKYEGRHLDGINTNNILSNLAWGTKSENTLDQVRHGTHHYARRTHCPLGHKLVEPNLAKQSGRRCRSCQRAGDKIRHGGLDKAIKENLADQFYAETMIE